MQQQRLDLSLPQEHTSASHCPSTDTAASESYNNTTHNTTHQFTHWTQLNSNKTSWRVTYMCVWIIIQAGTGVIIISGWFIVLIGWCVWNSWRKPIRERIRKLFLTYCLLTGSCRFRLLPVKLSWEVAVAVATEADGDEIVAAPEICWAFPSTCND